MFFYIFFIDQPTGTELYYSLVASATGRTDVGRSRLVRFTQNIAGLAATVTEDAYVDTDVKLDASVTAGSDFMT